MDESIRVTGVGTSYAEAVVDGLKACRSVSQGKPVYLGESDDPQNDAWRCIDVRANIVRANNGAVLYVETDMYFEYKKGKRA